MHEGMTLGKRYQLLEQIGRGGMAYIYRARDLLLDRYVAVKILREDYSQDPTFQERFRQEARAAARLSHPNIVTVHDFGLDGGKLYIVMEYIPGTDLKTLLRKRGRFGLGEAVSLVVQACAGIGYAHRAGLVHCDVKPHNMLVTPEGRLKVTDFGIARALATLHPEEQDVVWGSPLYFSPEQAAGHPPTPASDVYSLGVVLYELLAGTPPFLADTPQELARLHLYADPTPIREYVPDIPPALEAIIHKVLSKEPSARYRTADQLGRVLVRFALNGDASGSSPTPVGVPLPTFSEETTPPPGGLSPAPAPIPRRWQSALPPIDWVTIGLGLLALLAVGGLIPFWMWVYFIYHPPLR